MGGCNSARLRQLLKVIANRTGDSQIMEPFIMRSFESQYKLGYPESTNS